MKGSWERGRNKWKRASQTEMPLAQFVFDMKLQRILQLFDFHATTKLSDVPKNGWF